ncbi:MAG: hypothetical protein IJ301_04745 [Clostridia bacterium]|nr:hypothetical protein [Clostridia bacterium]
MTEQAKEKLYSDEKLTTTTFKCPNCGGEAEFDAKEQKMRCLYCSSMFDVESDSTVSEQELGDLLSNAKVWKEAEVYQCQMCGAKEILDKQEVALSCPFCGTSNVVKIEELPGLKPQGIVPFKIDREKAGVIAQNWMKRSHYAPRAFKKSAKPENIAGIYNPVFTFDTETRNSYTGTLGKNYTSTRIVNGHVQTYTQTRYFKISGSQNVNFDDFPVQASSNMTNDTIRQLAPFPTNDAPTYKTEYLRGYSASTYNKDGNQCWSECQTMMKQEIENAILKKYDYDVKQSMNVTTSFLKQKYKYVLVPVYVGHCKYRNKVYNFYINGSTGKVTGKTPLSVFKVCMTVLFWILIIGGIFAIAYLD